MPVLHQYHIALQMLRSPVANCIGVSVDIQFRDLYHSRSAVLCKSSAKISFSRYKRATDDQHRFVAQGCKSRKEKARSFIVSTIVFLTRQNDIPNTSLRFSGEKDRVLSVNVLKSVRTERSVTWTSNSFQVSKWFFMPRIFPSLQPYWNHFNIRSMHHPGIYPFTKSNQANANVCLFAHNTLNLELEHFYKERTRIFSKDEWL